jgi:ADP-dependent phosphofructokinase/glucokinase
MAILSPARREIYNKLFNNVDSAKEERDISNNVWENWQNKNGLDYYWTHSNLLSLVRKWNTLFMKSVLLPPTKKTIACGFSANIDVLCKYDVDQLYKVICNLCRDTNSRNLLIKNIIQMHKMNALPSEVNSKIEVLAFLIVCMIKNVGQRPYINSNNLLDWIKNIFPNRKYDIGGAAAFLEDFFTKHLDERYVSLICKYISDDFKMMFNPDAHQVLPKEFKESFHWIDERINLKNQSEDPKKINISIEWSEGCILKLPVVLYQELLNIEIIKEKMDNDTDYTEITITNTNRTIFRSRGYLNITGSTHSMKPTFRDSVFNRVGVQSVDRDPLLYKLGYILDGFLCSGIHYLENDSEEMSQLALEIEILKQTETNIHLEFSGSTSELEWINKIVKDQIPSFGVGDEELISVNLNLKIDSYPRDPVCPSFSNYKNAVSLYNYLKLERLHVHAHDIDMVFRKKTDNAKRNIEYMNQEIIAVLFAKYLVAVHVIQQNPNLQDELDRLLKENSYYELINLAKHLFPKSRTKARTFINTSIHNEQENPFIVAFIPSKWPDKVKITTSAGDLISAVSYVYGYLALKR